jgi:hypothetical protein
VSSHLAADKTLELLEQFKGAVQEIGGRAAKFNEGLVAGQVREKRRYDAALEEERQQLAAALGEAEAVFQATKAAAQTNYEQRKVRIGKAFQSSKEQALKRIDEKVGACRYELQKKMLQAEKDKAGGLAAAAASLQEFKGNLETEQQSLAQLEGVAQRAFGGYKSLQRAFLKTYETVQVEPSGDETSMLSALRERMAKARQDLDRLRGNFLLGLFRFFPAWVVVLLGILVAGAQYLRSQSVSQVQAAAIAGGVALILALRFLAKTTARSLARQISEGLASARRLHDLSLERAETHHREELERIQNEFVDRTRGADQQLKQAQSEAAEQRVACRIRNDERTVRVMARHEQISKARRARLEKEYHEAVARLKQGSELRLRGLSTTRESQQKDLGVGRDTGMQDLAKDWEQRLSSLYQQVATANAKALELFPPWGSSSWSSWTPPAKFAHAAKFGEALIDVGKLCETLPRDKELVLPGPAQFQVPLCLVYPDRGSILFETNQSGHGQAVSALNNIILRLLSMSPPGRLKFTIIDPVGLGQNFAGVMHLADYEEQLINSRIWTQSGQIEQRLADLNEHMEKVIQMYLRNEYQTIAQYNEQAGVIAEKYHFLVVSDFPANFTDTAAKRLLSIAASGARCGVFTLIHWDRRQPPPQDFIPDELRKSSVCVSWQGNEPVLDGRLRPGVKVVLAEAPAPDQATELIHQIGRLSRDSGRVEVPFEQVAPAESEVWSEDTTTELRVPIGRTGATKLQYLEIGKGTLQHGLVAGKTGSGKSTLFHVIITNLALWCSPEQVEFYLVDFKKGVEFKCYGAKRLPHARVVAIESDREFGLSVLQRVDDELRRRGDLFRHLGVQDIAGYKRAGGTESIPRTLLLIDEFQEFFVEDDKVSQTASLLLDRIVRQGRAFGIHVLLGSQTLGGAYTVARTTLGQMVIRIALQCNEADAYLIMDENNPAPRLLSRPGEGIYNDMAGALEGNSPFQVVWLPERVRDAELVKVRERADRDGKSYGSPIVFEGNAPADVNENELLRTLIEAPATNRTAAARIWLGAPNSIKGPTEAVFRRQSGNNLLIVGQREEAILAMFSVGLVSLAAQFPKGAARFILMDATPPGTSQREHLERAVRAIPHSIELIKPGDMPDLTRGLAADLKQRAEEANPDSLPPVFLLIHGLQRFAKFRYEEDFGFSAGEAGAEVKPAAVLNDLLCEGARLGFHVIAACDTYNNVTRFLSRKALSECEMRVLFQMSANDSASLIDNPKAGMLGLHRALFYNAQEGYLETFRPYALPDSQWIDQIGQKLRKSVTGLGPA